MYKDVRRKYLHGEIVAMALPLQLAVNGSPEAEIEEFYGHDYAAMEGSWPERTAGCQVSRPYFQSSAADFRMPASQKMWMQP